MKDRKLKAKVSKKCANLHHFQLRRKERRGKSERQLQKKSETAAEIERRENRERNLANPQ